MIAWAPRHCATASKAASTVPPCAVSGKPWKAGSSVRTAASPSPDTASRSAASVVVMR
jgi:hypothetical protein